jgi:hypothetical protein
VNLAARAGLPISGVIVREGGRSSNHRNAS